MVMKGPENLSKCPAITRLHVVNLADPYPLLSCLHELDQLSRLTMEECGSIKVFGFPASRFVGFDLSPEAVTYAKRGAKEQGGLFGAE